MRVLGLAAVALVASIGVASAATVKNGSFEEAPMVAGDRGNDFNAMPGASKGGKSWDVWQDLPGWTTTSGAGIEVQSNRTLGAIDAHSGQYYVELDSHNNSSMAQTIALTAGSYDLKFWYAPRTSNAATNGISYGIADLAGSITTAANTFNKGLWTEVVSRFTIEKDGDYVLSFAATGTSDSYGGLIDSISVSEVPLPASALLLLGGLAGLGAMRRRAS